MANRGEGVGVTNRVAHVTIAKWVKKLSDLTKRKLIVLAKLEKSGLITYGHDGGQIRWPIEKDEHLLNGFVDARPVNFQRVETTDNAFLGWRGYYLNDFITRQEKLENGGPSAMLKVFNNKEKTMKRSAMRRMAAEIYKDGNSVAGIAANRFHGIESFMGVGAQTDADVVATTHNDTYANLSTAVGGLNSEFDRIWTPVIVSTNRNEGAGNLDWNDYADEYIREANIRGSYGQGSDENFDLCTLNRDAYRDLLNIMDGKERIQVNRGAGAELVSLGFKNMVEIDGLPCVWDSAVPTTDDAGETVRGYCWTTEQMELMVLGPDKQLFKVDVTFSSTYQGDEIFIWSLGNLRFESPRYFGKLVDLAVAA